MTSLLLHDNGQWEDFLPLTFTRPIAEMRVGILKIREKWENHLGRNASPVTETYLNSKFPAQPGEQNLLVNATVLPAPQLIDAITKLEVGELLKAGNAPVAAIVPSSDLPEKGLHELEDHLKVLPYNQPVDQLNEIWDLFEQNGRQINEDFELITQNQISISISHSNTIKGDYPVFAEEGASVEHAHINATKGPVFIGKEASIMEGSLIRGPFALCEHGTVKMGAKIYEGTTLGPYCKASGEINNSILFGYSNKGHDGFLGNAVIGEWCNLGADTNNSNLKNDYSDVKIWNYRKSGFVKTGRQFCGLFMGDHSKTGINTMLNTGTVVGVSANIFGPGFPRIFIPSFSWGGSQGFTTFKMHKAIETAQRMMARRNIEFTKEDENVFNTIFEKTQSYRR